MLTVKPRANSHCEELKTRIYNTFVSTVRIQRKRFKLEHIEMRSCAVTEAKHMYTNTRRPQHTEQTCFSFGSSITEHSHTHTAKWS